MDDLLLFNGNSGRIYGMDMPAMSTDNLNGFPSATFDANYDFSKCFSNDMTTADASQLFRTTSADALSAQSAWYDNPLGTVAENPGDFATSPTGIYGEHDWNIPSATSDFFSPSDLPLSSTTDNFPQSISQSGESNQQSLPGLTASSSGAQSEIDGPSGKLEAFPSFWTSTVPYRESTPSSGASNNLFAFPASVPNFEPGFKPTSSPRRHRQTHSGSSYHVHNGSGSTTVPGDFGYDANVNIGHLQNLASLKSAQEAAAARSASQSPSAFTFTGESDVGAIKIPNSDNYYDDLYPIPPVSQASETSKQYSWLLDAA
jgi:hypothetical protein